MADRGALRGALGRGPPIELVVEDGFDGAIGPGADLDGPFGGRLDARRAIGADEPDDTETGAIALLGMGPALEDLLAQGRGRWTNSPGVFPRSGLPRPRRLRSAADLAGALSPVAPATHSRRINSSPRRSGDGRRTSRPRPCSPRSRKKTTRKNDVSPRLKN